MAIYALTKISYALRKALQIELLVFYGGGKEVGNRNGIKKNALLVVKKPFGWLQG